MSGIKYSTLKARSPCFDDKAKRDCHKRHKGCRAECPEWAAYELNREKERDEKLKNSSAENAYMGYVTDRAKRIKKVVKRK